ncbi:helix-turn-helix domain-containing protein (plasmid) [Burkholderia sp. M6-3]
MTIGAELKAQILRYYHVEKWRCGTIARQLRVHRGTVQRVLAQAGLPRIGAVQRASQIDAYLPFIHETLKKFPSLTARRRYAMVYERGYRGSHHHFRHLISLHRPRPVPAVAFRRKGAGCFRRNGARERRLIRGSNGDQESLFLPPFASADLLLSGIGRGTR